MQRLMATRWPRLGWSAARREVRVGIVTALLVAAGVLAAAVLYAVPFDARTYVAEMSEAQSVRVGDDIRVAGVPVGTVKSLELRADRVVMRFTVRSNVFLGDQTSLDVRMLTIVGGHYVAVIPAGTKPIGQQHIPMDRVRLPYSLMQAFQDATQPLRAVDGDTLHRNLSALGDSLQQNPDSLRKLLDGVDTFVDVLDRQRSDVSKAVSLADEYLTAINGARGELRRLIEKINLLETLLVDHRAELRQAVEALDRVVNRLGGLQPAWESTLKPMAEQLSAAADRLRGLGDKLEPLITAVHDLLEKFQQMVLPDGQLGVDRSGSTITGDPAAVAALVGSVCVPVPGKAC
ncbi:MCE family protein [Nocardia sp. NPDC004722]